ncbi:MAG: hypothetical protein Q9215_000195 [Flavoplaca cf. flavocitrina]
MKVLIMGMPRSGTMSLVTALKQLGYTPYDFIDRIILGHLPLWTEALHAKFLGQGKQWGKAELDRVVKGFDCVLDVPCPFFTEEFLSAYPDSVVMLNKRDPEPWLASMNSTLFRVFNWPSWPSSLSSTPSSQAFGIPIKYLDHYDYVRRVTPKERLLEYEVREGWEPLCRFLGKEIPEGDFPNVNDKDNFVKGHGMLWAYAVFNAAKNVAIGTASIGVGVAAW